MIIVTEANLASLASYHSWVFSTKCALVLGLLLWEDEGGYITFSEDKLKEKAQSQHVCFKNAIVLWQLALPAFALSWVQGSGRSAGTSLLD